ncbi:MAG: DUF192 domain-containing protein [Proteobacteria bacterium]|nr:DUF192 domain-containing protein [Pseudomonadota bacterium]
MSRIRSFLAGLATAAMVAVAGLAVSASMTTTGLAQERPMKLPVDPDPLLVTTSKGEVEFRIEIADEPDQRAMGLMYRKDLPNDEGMLFVFEQTQPVGFWMKNTPLPLDLLFIGTDGKVRDILPGVPFSEAVIAPAEPVRFVLELKAGTAEKSGIKVGDQMRHPAIQEAPADKP